MNRGQIDVSLVPDCAACLVRSMQLLIPLLTANSKEQFELFVHGFSKLSEGFQNRIAPHPLSVAIYRDLSIKTGVMDPFKDIKLKSNETAKQVLPIIEKTVNLYEGYTKLRAAVAASITGNLIDFNTAAHKPDLDHLAKDFQSIIDEGFTIDHSRHLWAGISRSSTVAYLADNAGETYLDIPLVRLLHDNGVKVFYVVKGQAMTNDATRDDVIGTELEELSEIMDNGAWAHGTPRQSVSQEFLEMLVRADFIISKGQANIETVPEIQKEFNLEVYYITKAKCPHIASVIGAKQGDNVVLRIPRR